MLQSTPCSAPSLTGTLQPMWNLVSFWAAWHITWLLIKLTPKSCSLFFSFQVLRLSLSHGLSCWKLSANHDSAAADMSCHQCCHPIKPPSLIKTLQACTPWHMSCCFAIQTVPKDRTNAKIGIVTRLSLQGQGSK